MLFCVTGERSREQDQFQLPKSRFAAEHNEDRSDEASSVDVAVHRACLPVLLLSPKYQTTRHEICVGKKSDIQFETSTLQLTLTFVRAVATLRAVLSRRHEIPSKAPRVFRNRWAL